jgi:HSP20 family protein
MTTYYMVPRRYSRMRSYQPVGFNGGRRVPVDVHANDDEYIITASVPGLKPEDLHVEILDDVVTLRSEIAEEENGDGKYLMREMGVGPFRRSLRLPVPVDSDKANAKVENGLLTVHIPKAEEVRPKEIKVKSR